MLKSILFDVIACTIGAAVLVAYLAITAGARMALHITPGDPRPT